MTYFKNWRGALLSRLICSAPVIPILLISCGGVAPTPEPPAHLQQSEAGRIILEAIEAQGGWAAWSRARTAEYVMEQPPAEEGQPPLRHRYTLDLHGGRVRIEDTASGVLQGWDGNEAWTHPEEAPVEIPARFSTRTEHFWFCLPWKLADQEANLELLEDEVLEGQTYHRVRVTYGADVGDTSEDWYIYYFNAETRLLEHALFIVTFFGLEPGQSEFPTYYGRWTDPKAVGGLKIVSRRRFGMWTGAPPEQYLYDERLVELSVSRQSPQDDLFTRPGR